MSGRSHPALALAVAGLLALFFVLPVAAVFHVAFTEPDGAPTLGHVQAFMQLSLMRESFANSLYVACMTVLGASLIAVPLAYFTARFEFRGAIAIRTLGVLPLVMPPFVGAVALQLLFGRSGSFNLLLEEGFGAALPVMEGLDGVVFVESLHYFPFILMNLTVAMENIDASMEEAAQNLGAHGLRLARRIVLPLAMPGFVAGAALVFIKVFDDLATPLVMGQTNLLAPQAYLRITSIGIEDPVGYVIGVIMVGFSIFALWLSQRTMRGRDYATATRGGRGAARRRLGRGQAVAAWGWIAIVLLLVLSPHAGILLLSLASVWSFSVLPDGYTLAHYATVLTDAPQMIANTLLYCGIAAGADVVVGVAIAHLVLRTRLPGRHALDFTATAALAIPGVVLGIGLLRVFRGVKLPFMDEPLVSSWVILVIALAVRRLPYALRSCMAGLQQLSVALEEAAQNLGATPLSTVRRIVIPLTLGGMLAGFVASFITAAVELSATLLLVARGSDAPMAYGIYLYMQSIAGRGPGAALGVAAVLIVAAGTYVSHRALGRRAGAASV
ncbi:MAG: iron ABC transporter permease [Rhodocyclaceae bacterium]